MKLFVIENRKRDSLLIAVSGALLAILLFFGVAWQVWPELSDSDAPTVEIAGIEEDGRYNSPLSISITAADDQTALASVAVEMDGKEVFRREIGAKVVFERVLLQTADLEEGEHTLAITIMDTSLWRMAEREEVVFFIDRTGPQLELQAAKAVILQGDTGAFFIQADEKLSAAQFWIGGREYRCYQMLERPDRFRVLFPVSVFASSGVWSVKFSATDLAGNASEEKGACTVALRKFEEEVIEVPASKAVILTDTKRQNNDAEIIRAAMAGRGDVQYWRGVFIRPTVGPESSPFGIRRVYSTGSIVSYHRGVDIANKEGTPVVASNAGKVLLAEELFVYGNTVILDHGQGLVTWYCHLSRIDVSKGDIVALGAPLGLMGTTGLSTGSHLHWEMQLAGVEVNPLEWLTESYE